MKKFNLRVKTIRQATDVITELHEATQVLSKVQIEIGLDGIDLCFEIGRAGVEIPVGFIAQCARTALLEGEVSSDD